MPKDAVVGTEPDGKAPPDSKVTLVVSDGPAPVTVPNVAKQTYDDAAAAITRTPGSSPQRSRRATATRSPAGQVDPHDPGRGPKVPAGLRGPVIVSKGTDIVLVPEPHRARRSTRRPRWPRQSGLTVAVQGAYSPGKKVRAQSPGQGRPGPPGPASSP